MDYELSYYLGKYRRQLLAGLIVCVVLVVGMTIWYNIWLAQQRAGKIAVPVQVVPTDASVTLSTGQPLPQSGTAYIVPGTYKVTVKREGFDSQTRDLRVSDNALGYIYIGLVARSDDAKAWQARHQAEYQHLETLTVARNRDYNALFESTNPIVNVLPIKDPYYSVDYQNHDDASVELVIWGTSPHSRQAALSMLRSKGYDPTDYRVRYDGFDNPLEAQ